MAKLTFYYQDPAPDYLWEEIYKQQFTKQDYITTKIAGKSFDYFPISNKDQFKACLTEDYLEVKALTLRYWIAEIEERGAVGPLDNSHIFIFIENTPRPLRSLAAMRYYMMHQDATLHEICVAEISHVLSQKDAFVQEYTAWLMTKKGMYLKTMDLDEWHNNFSLTLHAHPEGQRSMLESVLAYEQARHQ